MKEGDTKRNEGRGKRQVNMNKEIHMSEKAVMKPITVYAN